jgi:hypothetical protein
LYSHYSDSAISSPYPRFATIMNPLLASPSAIKCASSSIPNLSRLMSEVFWSKGCKMLGLVTLPGLLDL